MPDEKLPEQLETHREEIVEYVEKYSPRPTVDTELARRIVDEAPPAQAAEELEQLVDGFSGGGGAATGPRSMPAAEDPPTDRRAHRRPPDPPAAARPDRGLPAAAL